MIKLIRSDDRLIHGQCVTQVIPLYQIKNIIVVDDATASNSFLASITKMAAPKGVSVSIVSVQDSIDLINRSAVDDSSTLLLLKYPETLNSIIEHVDCLPKDMNIAHATATETNRKVTTFAYLSDEQIEKLNQLDEKGFHLWFQLIPNTALSEWKDLKNI